MRLLEFKKWRSGRNAEQTACRDGTDKIRLTLPGSAPPEKPPVQVLLVDDDPVILKTTSSRLRAAGYSVTTASDGSEALSALASQKPKFILLDICFPPDISSGGVPAWDGFRLMSWLRGLANTRGARYIIITGNDSPEIKEQARQAGAVAFLPKPLDHQELLAVLQQQSETGEQSSRRWWAAFFDFL